MRPRQRPNAMSLRAFHAAHHACWLALLLAASPPTPAQSVRVAATESVAAPTVAEATHELRLAIHMFRASRWDATEVRAAVTAAAQLLAQCGIAVPAALLHELEAPRRFHFYATRIARELLRELPSAKPAVFFVEDNLNRPAFDAEAIGRANAGGRSELTDTVWIAHGTPDLAIALAHELAHVLGDSGEHSDAPGNLMRPQTAPGNVNLDQAQCSRLRMRGEANGLLKPRVLKP